MFSSAGKTGLAGRAACCASFAVVALLVLSSVSRAAAQPAGSASSSQAQEVQGHLSVDALQFAQTVPSYARLGVNYTLRVVVLSNASIPVPVIVRVTAPVDAIFVQPRIVQTEVQPMSSVVANFTIVPFAPPRTGPYNLTALLYVFFPDSMSSPQLVYQTSAMVSTIGPNPFPYLQVVVVLASIVTLVLIVVFYRRSPVER